MQQVEKNEGERIISRTVPEDIKKMKKWKKSREDEESSGKNNK